jgi:hypothetical protein
MASETRRTLGILCTALIPLASGCGDECFSPGSQVTTKEVSCATDASASLTMPDGSTIPTHVVAVGQSCMVGNEVCSRDGFLLVEQISTDTDPYVKIAFVLSVPAGSTPTYALPSPAVPMSAGLYRLADSSDHSIGELTVVGGNFVVEVNRTQELRVVVQMTLETAAHERYGLVSGSATVSGCRVVNHTECRTTQIPLGG